MAYDLLTRKQTPRDISISLGEVGSDASPSRAVVAVGVPVVATAVVVSMLGLWAYLAPPERVRVRGR